MVNNMINKKDIIYLINKYSLDKNKFLILSGASLVLHGLKEYTRDIDITVSKEYCEELLNKYNCEIERVNEFGHNVYMIDNVINFGIDYNYENYDIINGIHTQNLEDIIKLKKYLGREKDIKDIDLIEKYINKKI